MIARPPEWMTLARCADVDPELFFPKKCGSAHAAVAVCRRCDVQAECLEFALARPSLDGVWGGSTPDQRQDRRRAMRQGAVA